MERSSMEAAAEASVVEVARVAVTAKAATAVAVAFKVVTTAAVAGVGRFAAGVVNDDEATPGFSDEPQLEFPRHCTRDSGCRLDACTRSYGSTIVLYPLIDCSILLSCVVMIECWLR
jgi:hypothetical protein